MLKALIITNLSSFLVFSVFTSCALKTHARSWFFHLLDDETSILLRHSVSSLVMILILKFTWCNSNLAPSGYSFDSRLLGICVSVCSGCGHKIPYWVSYTQTYSSLLRRLDVRNQGPTWLGSSEGPLPGHRFVVVPSHSGKTMWVDLSGASFIRALVPFMWALP